VDAATDAFFEDLQRAKAPPAAPASPAPDEGAILALFERFAGPWQRPIPWPGGGGFPRSPPAALPQMHLPRSGWTA
jgi:hypothetical protein